MDVETKNVQIKKHVDPWLIIITTCFSVLSLIFMFSASAVSAALELGNKYALFDKHVIFMGVGIVLMIFMARCNLKKLYSCTYIILLVSIILLAATLIPGIGHHAKGASRWVNLGFVRFQPLEIAKISLILYLAYFFSTKQDKVKTFGFGFAPPLLVAGIMCLLLLLQPDFGGAVFLLGLLFLMSFMGGIKLTHISSCVISGVGVGMLLVLQSPYRMRRILAFRDPFLDAKDSGYQLVQSLYAFGRGGWTGVGLGGSLEKMLFLPEAHNDFILAVLGEELGFIGVSIVFLLLGLFLWRVTILLLKLENLQDRLVAFGCGMMILIGGILNSAVVLGSIPSKGVPMPFLSYGGSHLIVIFFAMGILFNLSREVSK